MSNIDLSKFILGRRTVAVSSYGNHVEIDMPFGTLLVVQGRPNAFLPKGKGKPVVDGVMHSTKHGTTCGVGAVWLHQKGKTAKRVKTACALEVLAQAAKGGWVDICEAARANGTLDALRAELDVVYDAVSSAKVSTRQPSFL